MTDDSSSRPSSAEKQQSKSSRWNWSAVLLAGFALALAVHHGSGSLHTWHWEELGSVQPLFCLSFSFSQPHESNATACLVQVRSELHGASVCSPLLIMTDIP